MLAAFLPVASGAADARTSRSGASRAVQPLPSLDHSGHGHRLVGVTWAAGRAWLMVGSQRGLTVTGARVRGRQLASAVTTRVQAPFVWYPLTVGSDLLHSTARRSSGVTALRADGKVGPAQPASPDPMATDVGIPVAAAKLGDRLIWALAGGVQIGDGMSYRPTLQVCCDEAGSPVDHTTLISRRPAPRDHALGVDAQGRVWLAWLQLGRPSETRIVQLDARTLERVTPRPLVAPVRGSFEMVCATTCRLVMDATEPAPTGGIRHYIVSWAPGERSATRIRLAPVPEGRQAYPQLVGADFRSGRLAVAYLQSSSAATRRLNVVIGNARGEGARLRGSAELPERYSGLPIYELLGAFTPFGYVVGLGYSNWGSRVRMAATVVPLR
jgi:hypothetical protein